MRVLITNNSLAANNLTPALQAQNVLSNSTAYKFWDVNPAGGGPIIADKLWFYVAARRQVRRADLRSATDDAPPQAPREAAAGEPAAAVVEGRAGGDERAETAPERAEDVAAQSHGRGDEDEETGKELEGVGDRAEDESGYEAGAGGEQVRDEARSDPGWIRAYERAEPPHEAGKARHW